tara:strand:+ start:173 stop:367 length:195 start_codon:yes stop_codon:yes gene_type:complete
MCGNQAKVPRDDVDRHHISTPPLFALQARLAKNKKENWPAFVTRLLTPGHENPAMGFFWGVDHH